MTGCRHGLRALQPRCATSLPTCAMARTWRTKGVMVMTVILGRFFHWPTSDQITFEAGAVHGEVCRQISERRSSRASSATGGLAQRPRETLVIERDEMSPYWGFALVLAMAVGASFWVALIRTVMRLIR
jgi:hypothetical protein